MDKQLLDLGRQRLENVLDEASGLELATTDGVEPPTATARIPDAIWVLRSGSDEWRLLVEVKSTLWPRGVEGMAAQAKALAAEAVPLPGSREAPVMPGWTSGSVSGPTRAARN